MLPVQRWSDARPAGMQGQVLASTMSRAQNRPAKGSILFQRRPTLPIWVYYLTPPHPAAVAWEDFYASHSDF